MCVLGRYPSNRFCHTRSLSACLSQRISTQLHTTLQQCSQTHAYVHPSCRAHAFQEPSRCSTPFQMVVPGSSRDLGPLHPLVTSYKAFDEDCRGSFLKEIPFSRKPHAGQLRENSTPLPKAPPPLPHCHHARCIGGMHSARRHRTWCAMPEHRPRQPAAAAQRQPPSARTHLIAICCAPPLNPTLFARCPLNQLAPSPPRRAVPPQPCSVSDSTSPPRRHTSRPRPAHRAPLLLNSAGPSASGTRCPTV